MSGNSAFSKVPGELSAAGNRARVRLGVDVSEHDYVVALAGNPNTGKSTIFNALTGLRQHTGNWPGKTVTRAEGGFVHCDRCYKLVDLPGTYSLLSTSIDEEIARNFILFGRPAVTVIVVDATRLERNLNLALQVLEITDRVVVCLNLMDEAERHGQEIDAERLSEELGVPVVATAARFGKGIDRLLDAIDETATGRRTNRPHRFVEVRGVQEAVNLIERKIRDLYPELPNVRWIALRLLDGDQQIIDSMISGEISGLVRLQLNEETPQVGTAEAATVRKILDLAEKSRFEIGPDFQDRLMEALYADAARIAGGVVRTTGAGSHQRFEQKIDRIVTSRLWGFPIMLAMLTIVFWLTISGSNYPSSLLAELLVNTVHPALKTISASAGLPWWLDGLLLDGMYLATAWVVSVMLPPMAIFFPLFSLLEDLGFLPRIAFNLDNLFKKVGAHGKQALTMTMGFGCNAAGVIAARIIDSPRERLIAILTNNFSLCNGRWPTQILIASIFIGALVPARLAGFVSALAVVSVALLGVSLTFLTSWLLSRTVLRGEVSAFTLELPPYRPPRILQTIYTSFIDRTIFVLWRAVLFALPAGALIWLSANIRLADFSLAEHAIRALDPFGILIGLNGVILLAYVVAIPANEIVIPTVLMLIALSSADSLGPGAGVMFELDSVAETGRLLKEAGWTLLTAVNLMLFSLIHNPCTTTIYTIFKETGSVRWTALATLFPVAMGFAVTFLVAAAFGFLSS